MESQPYIPDDESEKPKNLWLSSARKALLDAVPFSEVLMKTSEDGAGLWDDIIEHFDESSDDYEYVMGKRDVVYRFAGRAFKWGLEMLPALTAYAVVSNLVEGDIDRAAFSAGFYLFQKALINGVFLRGTRGEFEEVSFLNTT